MFVRPSARMSNMQCFENKTIRMPKALREYLGVSVGEFIRLDNDVMLQVDKPYKTDMEQFGLDVSFVTESTYFLLNKPANEEIEIVNTITLGCDPEMFLVNANSGFQVAPDGLFNRFDAVGFDGMLCELRPGPHTDASVVRDNLFELLTRAKNRVDKYGGNWDVRFIAASAMFDGYAGFHCHLGIPKLFLDKKAPNYKLFTNLIAKALDFYVGALCVIPEGDQQNARRCLPFVSYGKVSDCRVDNRTLEYRVPGGIMMIDPSLAEGMLSICSMVTNDMILKLKDYTNNYTITDLPDEEEILKTLYPNIPDLIGLINLICSPTTELAQQSASVAFEDYKQMVNYNSHKEAIEKFKTALYVEYDCNDIWFNWTNRRRDNVQQPMDIFPSSRTKSTGI